MLATAVAIVLTLAVLAAFAAIGLTVRGGEHDLEDYLVARGSQAALPLGLSFFASGLGAWILFAPPELGVLLGVDAVVGYALAAGAPFVVFALVGPALRRLMPSGYSLAEFVGVRFGTTASTFVVVVSVLYMAVFLTAELLAVASVAELLGGVPRALTVVAVAVATLAYTAYGGLRASLRTDRWQALAVAVLVLLALAAVFVRAENPGAALSASGLLGVDRVGVESAITLVIAVTAANLFHQGYWQRVWAASDDRALRRGAWIGVALTVPVVFIAGGLGTLAAALGAVPDPSGAAVSAFALVGALPTWVVGGVLVLGVALVASSVDTLENGLASLIVAERPALGINAARWITVAVLVPCVAAALVATSVLQLFLVADLLAAAIIGPVLLGTWRRATGVGTVAGGIAGLLGSYVAAWVAVGDLAVAWERVIFVGAVPTLPPFLGAVLASTGIAVLVATLSGRDTDLGGLEAARQERAAART